MANKGKEAKFFCENCGAEVPENAKLCKKCGKFFISVRCPVCGHTGTSSEFKQGCPNCGYAMKGGYAGAQTYDKAKALASILAGASKDVRKKRILRHSDSLPVWIYAVTGVLFVCVMFGIYSCMKATGY
ncbi:MAG: zinc ribbon domain-containing protein [Treponema sp.]|nr:zinc ribbon domain-containing protein [Treponema sp.]